MMICPKCGSEQEERVDCIECGIVFSKYNAMFQSPEAQDSTSKEASTDSNLQELQIKVRELSAQIIDVEFEKAERKKLRADLKNLEERIQKTQQQMESHIQQLENNLQNSGADSDTKLSPEIMEILKKSEEMEKKSAKMTDNLNRAINQLTSLWEKTGQNSFQITELRDQMVSLRNEALEIKNQMVKPKKNKTNSEPQTIVEDDVKVIRKNLEDLGQFISGLARSQ